MEQLRISRHSVETLTSRYLEENCSVKTKMRYRKHLRRFSEFHGFELPADVMLSMLEKGRDVARKMLEGFKVELETSYPTPAAVDVRFTPARAIYTYLADSLDVARMAWTDPRTDSSVPENTRAVWVASKLLERVGSKATPGDSVPLKDAGKSLSKAWGFYQDRHLIGLSKATQKKGLRLIRELISLLGDVPPASITLERLEDYRVHLLKRGNSPNTANIEVRMVRAFFRWLLRRKLIRQNPAQDLTLIRVAKINRTPVADEEIEKLIEFLDDSGDVKFADAVRFVGNTGLRLGEALNLKRGDWDRREGMLYVRCRQGYVTKDREDRAVRLNSTALEILERRGREEKSEFIFPSAKGTRADITNFGQCLRARVEEAGFKGITFYSLRHSFATRNAAFIPEMALAAMMGHSTPATTRKYYVHRELMALPEPVPIGGRYKSPNRTKRPAEVAERSVLGAVPAPPMGRARFRR